MLTFSQNFNNKLTKTKKKQKDIVFCKCLLRKKVINKENKLLNQINRYENDLFFYNTKI